jgi:hypothetical protein
MLFNRKPADARETLVDRLLESNLDQRRQLLMEALQRGDLRLSEADEVLHIVARLEALAAPTHNGAGAA